jgi:hypothetical protein
MSKKLVVVDRDALAALIESAEIRVSQWRMAAEGNQENAFGELYEADSDECNAVADTLQQSIDAMRQPMENAIEVQPEGQVPRDLQHLVYDGMGYPDGIGSVRPTK